MTTYDQISTLMATSKVVGSNAFARTEGMPLDSSSVFKTYADLVEYAASSGKAYEGQVVAVGDTTTATEISVYVLDNKAPDKVRIVGVPSDLTSHFDNLESAVAQLSNYLPLSGGTLSGNLILDHSDLSVGGEFLMNGNLNVGDRITNVGDNTAAIGNDLTVGSYNFFWKGLDLSTSTSCALIYLVNEQPRYPFPFIVKNGSRTQFQIAKKTVTISDITTYSGMSASVGYTTSAWACNYVNGVIPWRDDYNQLCIDIGPTYQTNLTAVQSRLQKYIIDAFTVDDGPAQFLEGHESEIVGTIITMVNNDKIAFGRCGKVLGILSGSVLCVDFGPSYNDGKAFESFNLTGGQFGDFDYDDACLVFIDKPLLSGPSNVSQYSSINVGALNKVLRRCSGAFGKQNVSEMDFAFAFGRKACAQHYCTFIWSPAKNISTDVPSTFNIGLSETLAKAHKPTYGSDIRIIGKDNKRERLYQYVWGCLSSDDNVKSSMKEWIGVDSISETYATKTYVNTISGEISSQIRSLSVSDTLDTGKILTSLVQNEGKISYSTKTLEISDVNNLESNLQDSGSKLSTLENDLWSSLSSVAEYDAPSALSFNEAISVMFQIAKALKKSRS